MPPCFWATWETQLAALAKDHGCGLTIGWAERDGDKIYNSASTFDRTGEKLSHYRKIQLWGSTEKATCEHGSFDSFFIGIRVIHMVISHWFGRLLDGHTEPVLKNFSV